MVQDNLTGEGCIVQRTKEKRPEPLEFAANAGFGALTALGITMILLFVASVLVVSGRLPAVWMRTLTVGALLLGSFAGACIAIRRHGSKALFVGLAEGAMLYAMTLIGGVFIEMPDFFGGLSVFLLAAAICGGSAAGLFGVRPKRRK